MNEIIQKMAELNKLEPNLYQWNNIRIAHGGKVFLTFDSDGYSPNKVKTFKKYNKKKILRYLQQLIDEARKENENCIQ
jgi:hypothetical protein